MKILFADKYPEIYFNDLEKTGNEIISKPDLTAEELPKNIKGINILVVRSTKVTAETIRKSDRLNLIIRAGAGTNTIAVQEASDSGILVCNTPGRNALAVAELAFGLLLAIDRNIPDNVIEMRKKKWDKKRFSKTRGLCGRKVGIIGLGNTGLAFAERAKAFGMELYAVEKQGRSPFNQERIAALGFSFCKDLNQLAVTCEVLTFHVPSVADTRGLINDDLLSYMQENAIIINTSRGDIVDDDDVLIKAMEKKNIRCGLDVFNDEPSSSDDTMNTPLSQHPGVYGTHHIGASTEQAQLAIAKEVLDVINSFDMGVIKNSVNLEKQPRASTSVSIRHYDRAGVLAGIFNVLKENNINVEQMENKIFNGAEAAFATLYTSTPVSEDIIKNIESIEHVICVSVRNYFKQPEETGFY
ncbi:MAG: ACT domain-containing protein [bacterium]|nr:ACT domain-containing protein [bacterium]